MCQRVDRCTKGPTRDIRGNFDTSTTTDTEQLLSGSHSPPHFGEVRRMQQEMRLRGPPVAVNVPVNVKKSETEGEAVSLEVPGDGVRQTLWDWVSVSVMLMLVEHVEDRDRDVVVVYERVLRMIRQHPLLGKVRQPIADPWRQQCHRSLLLHHRLHVSAPLPTCLCSIACMPACPCTYRTAGPLI